MAAQDSDCSRSSWLRDGYGPSVTRSSRATDKSEEQACEGNRRGGSYSRTSFSSAVSPTTMTNQKNKIATRRTSGSDDEVGGEAQHLAKMKTTGNTDRTSRTTAVVGSVAARLRSRPLTLAGMLL